VVVTGGASGIGKATAFLIARAGGPRNPGYDTWATAPAAIGRCPPLLFTRRGKQKGRT